MVASIVFPPWTAPADLTFVADPAYPEAPLTNPRGLKTYEKLAVLGDAPAEELGYVERTYFYDYKKRPIQIAERNPQGGISRTYYAYDIPGNILQTKEVRQSAAGAVADVLRKEYKYDNRRRMTREYCALNNGGPVYTYYTYNDLGQLVGKTTGDFINTSMKYNLQGWLTEKQTLRGADSLFGMQLRYYDPRFGNTQPSYTGNISEWSWCHGGGDYVYTYAYLYDQFSRLKDTKQYIGEIPYNLHADRNLVYDLNGNILTLERDVNGAWIHDFRYSYDGNQLLAVSDHSNPAQTVDNYTYDANGNMTHDGTHNLDLSYNHLNLIEKAQQGDTTVAKYSYLSDGTKFSATDASGNGLVYQGSLVYKKQGDALTLESALFSEGRLIPMTNYIEPQYFLTDHLGSVRMVLNGARNVIERNNYYAFGQRWEDQNQLISDNRYTYNGKEDQGFLKLPYICYGARQYDPLTGRWFNPDQLLEKMRESSPYAFCNNNPIKFIDKDGKQPGKAFPTQNAAAKNWGMYYNGRSILLGREMASSIYVDTQNNSNVYIYTEAQTGSNDGVTPSKAPQGKNRVATIHSHGRYEKGYRNNDFSDTDKSNAEARQADNYVATPNGTLKKYDANTGETTEISTNLQSDPNDPGRKNQNNPVDIPLEQHRNAEAEKLIKKLQQENTIYNPNPLIPLSPISVY